MALKLNMSRNQVIVIICGTQNVKLCNRSHAATERYTTNSNWIYMLSVAIATD
jgi:hypothetical protein